MKNLSIRTKLFFAFFTVILFLLVNSGLSVFTVYRFNKQFSEYISDNVAKNKIVNDALDVANRRAIELGRSLLSKDPSGTSLSQADMEKSSVGAFKI